jgi:predicted CXXCH cytochrome family protein
MRRSSRELSSRVSINVHRHPNRQRRLAWWLALLAGAGSLLWLAGEYVRGQHRHYQAGDVATSHRMFENECQRCHTTWAPWNRLISFRDDIPSTTDEQCETCHKVADHQPAQRLAHGGLSCAACHQEHRGAKALARPNDRFCVRCHEDLKEHGGKRAFANSITSFDVPQGHPEFLLNQLINGEALPTQGADKRETHAVEFFLRPGDDTEEHWQDRGRIRFNHARHLHARYDQNGKLVEGLLNEKRDLVDLSNKCDACHQPDAEHRYFQPIRYEAHCSKCHPLLFDPVNFPEQSVPHEVPEIVRGFLTETYTLRALRNTPMPSADKPDGDVNQPRRPFPGHREQQRLTKELASEVLRDVNSAEAIAKEHRHGLFGFEATGGCRYCHEVESIEPQEKNPLIDWKIVATQIPSRWLPHSDFHHEPHRLLSCSACHVGVASSENTGDVLIPSRAVCVACHASKPANWSANLKSWFRAQEKWVEQREAILDQQREKWVTQLTQAGFPPATSKLAPPIHGKESQSFPLLIDNADRGTRTDCIECHTYHISTGSQRSGPFVPTFTPATDSSTK